jgi:uncharacterized membrane protein
MGKGRIEAFSDGVIAIIITIMVLEFKVPHGEDLSALVPLIPVFLAYVLSFLNVGIYWNNHHHMFQAVKHIEGKVLWANLHLLFWLSLMPFATGFMSENHFSTVPVALYAFDLFMCAIAYTILVIHLIGHHGKDSDFAKAIGSDRKGKISLLCYLFAMPAAFVQPWISRAFGSSRTGGLGLKLIAACLQSKSLADCRAGPSRVTFSLSRPAPGGNGISR